ncbi:MAG TPA: hypothetical protein VMO24_02665 [Woeseiaceae bacterium]|nr:hypothetical protein [Woeseiaceae bacterium]
MSHRIGGLVVAFAVGLAVAVFAYQRVTDPEPARQRAAEEAAVLDARKILDVYIGGGPDLQIVDPLAPDRIVGKVYVYPTDAGFDVSGHYRRHDDDPWHPFLLRLDRESTLLELSVRDNHANLLHRSESDPRLRVVNGAVSE